METIKGAGGGKEEEAEKRIVRTGKTRAPGTSAG